MLVALLTKTLIAPLVPAGTMAELATMPPLKSFNVDTPGMVSPAGHAVMEDSGPGGTTVIFNEYACAAAGTLQLLAGTGKLRVEPAAMDGGPKAPVSPLPPVDRVSATRQGGSGKNASGGGAAACVTVNVWPAIVRV